MANYTFKPSNAPWRHYEIVTSFDGSKNTAIKRNNQSVNGINIKYNGYSKAPFTPGYNRTDFEYSGNIFFSLTSDSAFEVNLPRGGVFGVVGFLGNNYLVLLADSLYLRDGIVYYDECYNVDESNQIGNTKQIAINYDTSGAEISRNTITHTEGMIDYTNSSFKGRWRVPLENYFTDDSTRETLLTIECNFPIFETTLQALNYLLTGDLTGCVNLSAEQAVTEETKDYYIYNRYQESEVVRGIVSTTSTIAHQHNERILYNGSDICLYRYDDSNPFKLKIKCGSGLIGSFHSATSAQEVANAELSQFTLDTLIYDAPFYSGYNSKIVDSQGEEIEITDYEGYLGILGTNIPIWNNESDADDYIAGDLDATDAYNWRTISDDPSWRGYAKNTTGEEVENTQMGEVFVQSFFSQMYICESGAINQIAAALYDTSAGTGIWDAIKQGVEMYGENPMNAVQGLMYYPFDLLEVFTNTSSQNYVYFGGYKLDISSTVNKIIFANGYKSIGTIRIKKTFKDWRDYEPYTKLYVYLPYCGTFQLELARYYDKTTEVRYYIDPRTGGCLVCLIADGILIDYFNGQMGVQMPITLMDKSAYANSQIQTLLQGASGAGGILRDFSTGISSGFSLPVTGAFSALQVGMQAVKTTYDVTQNNKSDYNKTSGGSTSMLNEFLPQHVTFMFEIQQMIDTANENELQGQPSNASGAIKDFSGYLEVSDVNLICGIATENEKRTIQNALMNGIII